MENANDIGIGVLFYAVFGGLLGAAITYMVIKYKGRRIK